MTETEAGFLDAVLALARLHGWRCHHQRPAWTHKGFRTALQGDKGFPDIFAAHPRFGVVLMELKVGKNKTTPDQDAWLEVLRAAGIPAYVFYPDQWPEIEATLRGGRA